MNIDRNRIDTLLKTVGDSDKARLTTLYNATVSTLKAYNQDSTASRLRDWQASEKALTEMVEEIEGRPGGDAAAGDGAGHASEDGQCLPGKDPLELKRRIHADADTDLQFLLMAKNDAKRRVLDDPSAANLAAFDKAKRLLALAAGGDEQGRLFKNRAEALRHLQAKGYKVQKSKFYKDVGSGLCHLNPDGKISEGALMRYVQHPGAGLIQGDAIEDQDDDIKMLLRREKQLVIDNLEIKKRKDQFNFEKDKGLHIPRADVDMELVSRAIALKSHLAHRFTTRATELSQMNADQLRRNLLAELDASLTEYANTTRYHVIVIDDPSPGVAPE
ncbi:hypothetical protein [uncultured Desulfosarcina sp.]|uniref:hypothetical protein n=1 Tax=uncultured Desulfosarcina sp. TaxID=218289 RepID=UPI0029C904C7|nr:hypothetical protein [uncultured Desulfosarcina sp.]